MPFTNRAMFRLAMPPNPKPPCFFSLENVLHEIKLGLHCSLPLLKKMILELLNLFYRPFLNTKKRQTIDE